MKRAHCIKVFAESAVDKGRITVKLEAKVDGEIWERLDRMGALAKPQYDTMWHIAKYCDRAIIYSSSLYFDPGERLEEIQEKILVNIHDLESIIQHEVDLLDEMEKKVKKIQRDYDMIVTYKS
ncbi:MAG: hypothetical protein QXL34_06560 [Thermosphaera sp.]